MFVQDSTKMQRWSHILLSFLVLANILKAILCCKLDLDKKKSKKKINLLHKIKRLLTKLLLKKYVHVLYVFGK